MACREEIMRRLRGYLRVAADLMDVEGSALCPDQSAQVLHTRPGIKSTHAPSRQRSLEGNWSSDMVRPVQETVGELLFPFEARDPSGKVVRFLPTKEQVERDINAVR
jgi:hypothetical protein